VISRLTCGHSLICTTFDGLNGVTMSPYLLTCVCVYNSRARPALVSNFEPEQPPRSVYLGYSPDTFGLLLLPRPKKRGQAKKIDVGTVWGGLRIVNDDSSATATATPGNPEPDSYPVGFWSLCYFPFVLLSLLTFSPSFCAGFVRGPERFQSGDCASREVDLILRRIQQQVLQHICGIRGT